MQDLEQALKGIFYIATVDENNHPRVRPFDNAIVIDDKLYIGTNNNKKVYDQIKNNGAVEIYTMEKGETRFEAIAKIVEDKDLNKTIIEEMGKQYNETSAAIELTDIKGYVTTSMGEKKEI